MKPIEPKLKAATLHAQATSQPIMAARAPIARVFNLRCVRALPGAARRAAAMLLCTVPLLVCAAPLPPSGVPEPLKTWVPWVLHGQDLLACPLPFNGEGERTCIWPSKLTLEVNADRARFRLEALVVGRAGWVLLPGEMGRWPQEVQANGAAVGVVPREARPAVLLPAGSHVLTGSLQWPSAPLDVLLPQDLGTLQVQLNGRAVPRVPDEQGRIWLQQSAAQAQVADSLTVRTARLIDDNVPLHVTTQFDVAVAGQPRELSLPLALLPGFIPEALQSPLPARLAEGGVLRVQVRPGNWVIQVRGRLMKPTQALTLPADQAEELWSFSAHNDLRLVTVEGMPSVDPKQVAIPKEWQSFPTYLARAGQTLKLTETRRGNPEPGADQLSLVRQIWLDFDGAGYTLQDQVAGQLRRHWRLDMAAPAVLGRVSAVGVDMPITRLAGASTDGVELRYGALRMQADSRLEGAVRTLPATGWQADFQKARAVLHLPPGWRLLHATGVDNAQASWISQWSLWDFFFVLLSVLAAGRLLGWMPGLLVAATLVLTWHMPGALHHAWLLLLALLALQRVLPGGRWPVLDRLARWGGGTCVLLMGLWLLPYAIDQIRLSIHPGMERPHVVLGEANALRRDAQDEADVRVAEVAAAPMAAPTPGAAPEELALRAAGGKRAEAAISSVSKSDSAPGPRGRYETGQSLQQVDPAARVQTGPGLPSWQWNAHSLSWQGPVQAAQTLTLMLLPPWATALFRLAGLALAIASLFLMARAMGQGHPPAAAPTPTVPPSPSLSPAPARAQVASTHAVLDSVVQAGPVLALLLALALVCTPLLAAPAASPAQAGRAAPPEAQPGETPAGKGAAPWPDEATLAALRDKLMAPPDCLPQCAHLARVRVQAQGAQVQLRLELHALADTVVPLPGQGTQWRPYAVSVDGRPAPVRRAANGTLWMLARAGVNQVLLQADLTDAANVEIALPMAPQAVESQLQGWVLEGLDARGLATGALVLRRQAAANAGADAGPGAGAAAGGAGAGGSGGAPSDALPPFLLVERSLRLGLQWTVATRVSRVGESRAPARAVIPLLVGEAVNSETVRVEGQQALVQLGAEGSAEFVSTLKEAPQLKLLSTSWPNQIEVWSLEPSAQWHVDWAGIAPTRHLDERGQQLEPRWQPWPGEAVELRVNKPVVANGQTVTFDRMGLSFSPGLRATDVSATGRLRSSQGSNHKLILPEGVEFLGLWVDEQSQPIRPQGRELTVPITPGAHALRIDWREPRGMGWLFSTTAQGFGAAGVNALTQVKVPQDRVVLATGGPRVGPAVLFWGVVLALAVVAYGLARTRLTPLSAAAWFLLGLGLAQASLLSAAVLAGWFFLLAARRRVAPLGVLPELAVEPALIHLGPRSWNLMQVVIGLWTLAAVLVLLETVRVGLLGYPDMMVLGNGSDAYNLRWYQDRYADQAQTAWVASVPVLAYRLLMLLWALWLAASVLKWVRWAWDGVSGGGLWQPRAVAAPVVAAAPEDPAASPS